MRKESLQEKIWEILINPEIKRRGSFFLLLAVCSLLAAAIMALLGENLLAMIAMIAFMSTILLWSGNTFIIKMFYNQGKYGIVSLILNYYFHNNMWEIKKLEELREEWLIATDENHKNELREKIRLLTIWHNQIK